MRLRYSTGRFLRYVGVLVLALVTVAVIVLAFRHVRMPVPEVGETPGYSPVQSGAPKPAPTPDQSAPSEAPEQPAFAVAPISRILGALDAQVAYRSAHAQCGTGPAALEVTSDGGQTWVPAAVGEEGTPLALRRVVAGANGYVAVIGAREEACSTPTSFESFDQGGTWAVSDEALGQSWFVDPVTPSVVHTPAGTTTDVGCSVARLAVGGVDNASLLCENGTVEATADGGETWATGPELVGAEALATGNQGLLVLRAGGAECAGMEVIVLDQSLTQTAATCVPQLGQPAPGQSAIDLSLDGVLWVWSGDQVLRSTDNGATWL